MVIGVEVEGEVTTELVVAAVVVALDRGFLERPVHSFDLPVGPRMMGLGQAVLDVLLCAGQFEGVGPEDLTAVHGLAEEVRGDARGDAFVELGKRELRGAVDGAKEMKLALLGPDLGDVDVGEANPATGSRGRRAPVG